MQAQPCKTLQRAVTVTGAGGTIRILSDLPAQNATIAKSLTVEGGRNSMVGTIIVNSASAVVALRGLNLTGRGAVSTGINISSAVSVHIEDCTVERYIDSGIKLVATTAIKLFVSNTVARDNSISGGLFVDDTSAKVEISDSRFENNGGYGVSLDVAKANVFRSIASGNSDGYRFDGSANITESTAADNSGVGFHFLGTASATVAASVVRGNGQGVYLSTGAAVSITESVITSNSTYAITNNGTLYTRQNNTVGGSYFGAAAIPFAAF